MPSQRPLSALLLAGALLAVLLGVLGLGAGSTGWQWPWGGDDASWRIVWEIRAPRTFGAALVGALLGLAGALAQGLFRNPLAEPYLLGSASGAALLLAVVLAMGWFAVDTSAPAMGLWARLGWTGVAFVGAVAGVGLTLLLARGATDTLRLLLAGVVVGGGLGALTQLLMLWSAPVWRAMQAFMLGSTSLLGWPACGFLLVVLMLALPVSLLFSRVLDALTLGADTARTLGVPLTSGRWLLLGMMTLSTAVVVGQVGLVAFVGLVAPHLSRPWSGARHVRLLCLSAVTGGLLLMLADVLARMLLSPQELPVGAVTAVCGGVYLLWVLWRKGRAA